MPRLVLACVLALAACTPASASGHGELDAMIARHAAANGIPASLVHGVVQRESRYNPSASHAGNHGLMQIRSATAHGMGYRGGAAGLLNPETNLTYAVAYLAGAYRAARGNPRRAMALYRSGYHGVGPRVAPAVPGQVDAARAAIAAAGIPAAQPEADPLTRFLTGR